MRSTKHYIATITQFGTEVKVEAPSIRQLSQQLNLCYQTVKKLIAGKPDGYWANYINIAVVPKETKLSLKDKGTIEC